MRFRNVVLVQQKALLVRGAFSNSRPALPASVSGAMLPISAKITPRAGRFGVERNHLQDGWSL
jgi:hypothetical protein